MSADEAIAKIGAALLPVRSFRDLPNGLLLDGTDEGERELGRRQREAL